VTDSTELLAVSLRAYREGYKAALTTVALAFGIAPQAITLQPLEELGTIQTQDKALRRAQDKALGAGPQDATPRRGGEPEITYLSPKVGAI
jgi:hypothetical protein